MAPEIVHALADALARHRTGDVDQRALRAPLVAMVRARLADPDAVAAHRLAFEGLVLARAADADAVPTR